MLLNTFKVFVVLFFLIVCAQSFPQEKTFISRMKQKEFNNKKTIEPIRSQNAQIENTRLNVTSHQFHHSQPTVKTSVFVAPKVQKVKPFLVQQPVVSWTGEVILENSIEGIPFDCSTRPTGHWRDTTFCDIYHACVWGNQRKTYLCPIVGERTYFDEHTQRCEFVHLNPTICLNTDALTV